MSACLVHRSAPAPPTPATRADLAVRRSCSSLSRNAEKGPPPSSPKGFVRLGWPPSSGSAARRPACGLRSGSAQGTGVVYHPGHVWRLLRYMGWSRQRPARRAQERDEAAIEHWMKTTWPALRKGALRERRWIVFEDESGFSLTPPLRQTWAPRGRTPVVHHRFNWKRVSATSALCYLWDGERARLYFQTHPGTYNDANRGDGTVDALIELATGGVRQTRSDQPLLFAFLGQTGLAL
jgi:hypothetical protein